MPYRRNAGADDVAKMKREEAARIAKVRARNKALFDAKQERIVKAVGKPSRRELRTHLAIDKALAATEAKLEAEALDVETEGMTPQQRANWIRHGPHAKKNK